MTENDAPLPAPRSASPSRRRVVAGLAGSAALAASPALAQGTRGDGRSRPAPPAPPPAPAPARDAPRVLVAAPGRVRLRPAPAPDIEVWAFDGAAPGPALRCKPGETLRIRLDNRTEKPLALHWHGLRHDAAMDGIGGFSQEPVAPGASFEYRLAPTEPGTHLYRPLLVGGSAEPADRGLSGLLIVEEAEPPVVDLDLPVLIDDWLLGDDHKALPFAADAPENAAAGRLGNWLTTNGKPPPERVTVAPGARVRLRLANAANARITRLRFDGVKAYVVAVDGQPNETFEPVRAQLPFPPGTRYDVVLDMPEEVGATAIVTALIGPGLPLLRLVAEGAPPARKTALPPIAALPANPALPAAVRLQNAVRPEIVIAGGARITPDFKLDLAGVDLARPWSLNGGVGDAKGPPLFSVRKGTPIVLALVNRTAFAQPMHVHGHCFRLLHPLDDGWEPYFLDTIQVPENRTVRIAFIAEFPGRWLISSTVLERFDKGLWSFFEVT